MTAYPINLGQHRPCRSLEQALAEYREQLDLLPPGSPTRGALVARIRGLADEIAARGRG